MKFKFVSRSIFASLMMFGYACEVLELKPEVEAQSDTELVALTDSNSNMRTTQTRVLINGEPLSYTAEQPYASAYDKKGTVMVSANAVFKALEWDVNWDENAQKLTLTKDWTTLKVWIGNTTAKVNGNDVSLPTAPELVNNSTIVPLSFITDNVCAKVDWDEESKSVQMYYWNKLDYGIYFYDAEPGSEGSWDAVGCQKYVPGQANPFYDPEKPTVLYLHGYQFGAVPKHLREDFRINDYGANEHTQNYWKERGYNVAIFHWVQFADDGLLPPNNVEFKIYSPTDGVGMRWKKYSGGFVDHGTSETMADLFASEYQKVFNNSYYGGRIHVIGNSLGGNLAMAGMVELHERSHDSYLMPERVTLIDPYWSQSRLYAFTGKLPYDAFDTKDFGGIATEIVYENYNTAIEYYRTSLAGTDGSSHRAMKQSAFIHYGTNYTSVLGTVDKHTVPVRQYMWSINYDAPTEVSRNYLWQPFTATGEVAASAKTSDDRIREMMGTNNGGSYKHWYHKDGRSSVDPGDDIIEIRNGYF